MFFLSGPCPGLAVVMNVFVDERNLLTLVEVGGGYGQFVFVHRTQVDLPPGQLSSLVGGAVNPVDLLVNKLHSLQAGALSNTSYYESFNKKI